MRKNSRALARYHPVVFRNSLGGELATIEYSGVTFRVYRIDPAKEKLELVWKGTDVSCQPMSSTRKRTMFGCMRGS